MGEGPATRSRPMGFAMLVGPSAGLDWWLPSFEAVCAVEGSGRRSPSVTRVVLTSTGAGTDHRTLPPTSRRQADAITAT